MKKWLLLLVFAPVMAGAQSRKQKRVIEEQRKADEKILTNLKSHIVYLSDDKLEGRQAGSKGEELAMQYISEQFKTIGLQPRGTEGYIQAFPVDEGKQIESSTYFRVNEKPLQVNTEFIPLAFSPGKSVKGSAAITFRESGEPWFTDVKDMLENNKTNPHFDIGDALVKEAAKVAARGATALVVFNSSTLVDNISFNKRDTTQLAKIPVVYITREGMNRHFSDRSATLDIALNVKLQRKQATAHNVIGYLNNNAANTVVIGAHYDHLGWGENGNALDTGKVIRNGADDNASGTAAVLEIARLLAGSKSKNNNYLFITFSGEELGLLGSKYWLDNAGTDSTNINYMINMDMVGRYTPEQKLTIGGYGTSPVWGNVFTSITDKNLSVRFDSTGSGPSDHAAFYRKNIPVLFFFTGIHSDYHKASDDWDKINLSAEVNIVKYIQRVIEATDARGKLAFNKTSEQQMNMTAFSVTLGIMPDYSFTGNGLRVDGVSPNKVAEKAGLQAGDIILQLGDYKINEINSYMKALSSFKKGDNTRLRYSRSNSEKTVDVQFQ
ncbi:M20/M25/M40 family metallo-hydrolase [Segetibacter sp. 3557_3]|uniref:M20/M25/M40 family metallo-hydrolase n=1 Tax=Segetibacter sp. 3557_3 TaxID=2547429 RepID=UPI001058657E|nr:M20/M25/M40 family metallo-hydrolase [Segetibacter sp. 3557_3]TDH19715.1 M20/M25/M40 family metallo-hydrolase [Segetibacter sp. 3557_3]